jgi:hypothetical protein
MISRLTLHFVVVALGICGLNACAADQDTADKREMLSKHKTVAEFEGTLPQVHGVDGTLS